MNDPETGREDDGILTEKRLQIDLYGIKLSLAPSGEIKQRPTTWKEVLRRINQHLMTIAEGSFGTLADALQGLRSLIRGTTELPGAVARRVAGAHKSTARREKAHQEVAGLFVNEKLYLQSETISALERKLEELRTRGLAAGLTFDSAGNPVLYAVEPGDLKALEEHVGESERET